MGTFSAQVKNANDRSKETLRKIAATAIQDVMSDAQTSVAQGGNMPVVSGFLINSLASELNGSEVAKGASSYVLALANMKLGDTVRFGWTAVYARRRHYLPAGEGRQGSGMWRDKAAQKWQSYVDAAAMRFKDQ